MVSGEVGFFSTSVVAINLPTVKPMPRAAATKIITGIMIAHSRHGSPATIPHMNKPARIRQVKEINIPPILNFVVIDINLPHL